MKNIKITKDNKIFIILIVVLLFLLVIIGVTIGVGTIAESNKKEFVKEETYSEQMTITCTNAEENNTVKRIEEVYLKKGILITRADRSEWSDISTNADTCKYYQTQSEGLKKYSGVSSNVNCNETSGRVEVIYKISEIDRSDLKLNQFDYLNEKNIFDYKNWIIYMSKKGYTCKTEE